MEASRIAWIALWLLALMLAAAPVREAQLQYFVGDIEASPNWYPQQDTSFYQNWADRSTLYVNDSLVFLYDDSSHDVTQLWSADDISRCWIADTGAYFTGGSILLYLVKEGAYYLTSTGLTSTSISSDCQQGMRFSITVLSRDSSTPSPPPLGFSGNLPPGAAPAPDTGDSTQDGTPNQAFQIEINWVPQTDANFYTEAFQGFAFQAGSVLVFNFDKDKHNVVRVNQSDFDTCTVPSRPLGINNIPGAGVPLGPENGVYYFIDGIGNNCAVGNIKLSVQVGETTSNTDQGQKIHHLISYPYLIVLGLFYTKKVLGDDV